MNLRKEAKGRECTVRRRGVCNFNAETTVLAHLNSGGMGQKSNDIHACFACSDCHSWLDGGYTKDASKTHRNLMQLEAVIRTQQVWINEGLL